jgi:hypothetical protein
VTTVVYLEAMDADRDPLIRVSDAIVSWRVAFDDLKIVPITGRNGRWHVPLIERPKESVAAILAA